MTTTTCTVCELHAESTFKIDGMDCREEVAMIEQQYKNLPGLEDFTADLMGQRLHVKYDAAKLSASAIASAVADAGMRAWLEHEEPIAIDDGVERRRRVWLAASGAFFRRRPCGDGLARAAARQPPAPGHRDRRRRAADRAQGVARAPPPITTTSTC